MIFPTTNGAVNLIPASRAQAPFTYQNGFKVDALGRIVVVG